MEIDKVGIDLGKSVFHLAGFERDGRHGGAEKVLASATAASKWKLARSADEKKMAKTVEPASSKPVIRS